MVRSKLGTIYISRLGVCVCVLGGGGGQRNPIICSVFYMFENG